LKDFETLQWFFFCYWTHIQLTRVFWFEESPSCSSWQVRQGANIANVGAVVGGLATAAIAFKYSRSAVGAIGAFAGGAVVGWALAEEGASLGLGLYKFNCMDTNLKFLDWWEKKHRW
jgi:hypothetical protein